MYFYNIGTIQNLGDQYNFVVFFAYQGWIYKKNTVLQNPPQKNTFLLIFVNYLCDGKAEFSAAITPVFSVTWSFRNNFNMLIWSLWNISY